jgi:hypothetical protein
LATEKRNEKFEINAVPVLSYSIQLISLTMASNTVSKEEFDTFVERLRLVEMKLAELQNATKPRTRDNAGANEITDITTIVNAINSKSSLGLKLMADFRARHGKEILAARLREGGNRSSHYDFEILVDGDWKKVEHKGSQINTPIPETNTVCYSGVQFHNGGCNLYTFTKKYAKIWYTTYISSGLLAREFNITVGAPSFDDWYNKDCTVQGDPKTEFGIALKKAVRAARGDKTSLLEKRGAVNDKFDITSEEEAQLKKEVLTRVTSALVEKDFWLEVHGSLSGDCHVRWWPNCSINKINQVVLKKQSDIQIEFYCENNFIFHAYLRWGKGAGFSNLRVDLRHGPASAQRTK